MTTFIITDLKVNTDPETQQLDDTAWMNPGGQMVQYWEGGKKKKKSDGILDLDLYWPQTNCAPVLEAEI